MMNCAQVCPVSSCDRTICWQPGIQLLHFVLEMRECGTCEAGGRGVDLGMITEVSQSLITTGSIKAS